MKQKVTPSHLALCGLGGMGIGIVFIVVANVISAIGSDWGFGYVVPLGFLAAYAGVALLVVAGIAKIVQIGVRSARG